MTWVWVLIELEWEHWRVVGVFATKALAREVLKREDARKDSSGFHRGYSYDIERHRFTTHPAQIAHKAKC